MFPNEDEMNECTFYVGEEIRKHAVLNLFQLIKEA